ncbi:MAG: S41 family peptidase [Flammeovirgaceae bacterium]|nr:MAG: S41 family peptidase [Flammeovirgaceae bacterium]
MWRKAKWIMLAATAVAFMLAFSKPADTYFEVAKNLDIFATLFKEVNAYYVDEVDPKQLIRKGIDGMLESLDPYTDFIPEEELEGFRITTTGQYAGIGALIGIVNKKTIITHPYKNFPAYKAGLKVGDEIIAVDGVDAQGKSTAEVSTLLKGPAKTDVEIRIRRQGQKNDLVFKIKRERISIRNVAYAGMLNEEVGYIKLDDFTPGAGKEVADATVKLKQQGAKKLILDLRDNPGGMLHEAVNIVNLFIPKGKEVVSMKGKVADWNKTYTTLNNPLDTEIPMIVLTGEGSASASEIVAGALQDYDRAVLIGRKTFGKGLVQATRQLSYNAQLKVTTAKYYIPSGRCIQELDYTHRNADGTVDKVADSLKKEFKTSKGRKVFDGGGLDPDITIEPEYLGTVTVALISAGHIFEYASKYCGEHPVQPDLKTFRLPDAEYDKFIAWLKERKFSYSTPLEAETKQLIEAAKQERYYAELAKDLETFKNKVETNKTADFTRFKQEISEVLEQQIAFHYALNEGQALVSMSRDKAISESVSLLSDLQSYRLILTPQ